MMASIFDRFARWTERQLGHPVTFAVACLSIFLWGVTGPFSAGGPSPRSKNSNENLSKLPRQAIQPACPEPGVG